MYIHDIDIIPDKDVELPAGDDIATATESKHDEQPIKMQESRHQQVNDFYCQHSSYTKRPLRWRINMTGIDFWHQPLSETES